MLKPVFMTLLFLFFFTATAMAARPAIVQDVRYSYNNGTVRLVVDVTDYVDFREIYVENPSRLVVDIQNATLSSKVKKELPIENPTAKRVRVGQFDKTTVRVVIETIAEIKTFILEGGPAGYRLVIDVIGTPTVSGAPPSHVETKPSTVTKPSNSEEHEALQKERERQERLEKERKAKEEKERQEKLEKERKEQLEKERERKAKEERERKAKEEKERQEKLEKERKAKAEKERKAKEERERKAKEEKEREHKNTHSTHSTTTYPSTHNPHSSEVDKDIESLTTLKGKIIAIDPGHGGNDAGAIGPSGVMEKTVTLNVALELEKLLKAEGATVIMTRRTDKTVSPAGAKASAIEELQARCDIANKAKADIFISIHADSFTNPTARGTTGYYYSQTEGQSAIRLADCIRKALCEQIKTPSRGTKPCNFYVVRNTDMAATLIELAFISNPEEESIMNSVEGVLKCAQGIFDGIEDYFG
ncbi:MAG: N-acetylmuramoyl-L-alanine amidase [Selenomonadaceae bacterium]|nr:N-acetylmuramoyl-L-alanine amidase [Selenomonadaceae bacterium]